MSVRTNDPRPIEIYPPALCCEPGCGKIYDTICKACNLSFCMGHLVMVEPGKPSHKCFSRGVGFCDSASPSTPKNGSVSGKKKDKKKK